MARDRTPVDAHEPAPVGPAGDRPVDPADEASRRRAKKWWWAAGIVTLLLAGAVTWMGEQSGRSTPRAPEPFCKAAAKLEKEFENHGKERVDRQLALVEQLAATAPHRIEADAQTYLDAMRRVVSDESVVDDPAVERAVDNVNRYASQGCGVFDRQGGI